MMMRIAVPVMAAIAAIAAAAVAARAADAPNPSRVTELSATQVAYLTSCGGCHGVEGVSAPHAIPTLRRLTGRFLCTAEGRAFIIRLPDVALASLSDRMLAQVMNFVVFDLGAPAAAGRHARPYTAAEVGRLRKQPLTGAGLTAYRDHVVADLGARCPVPPALRVYGAGAESTGGNHR